MVKIVQRRNITLLPGDIGKMVREAEKKVSARLDVLGSVGNHLDRARENYKQRCAEALEKKSLTRKNCEESLLYFVQTFWKYVEPSTEFVNNWHIEAICDHLQAVTEGEITRLLINVPPGMLKSLLVDVFWPAWEWIHDPTLRYICTSYSQSLTERDNIRFRNVIMSEDYQRMWGDKYGPSKDSFSVVKVANNKTGWKLATSTGGTGTGERGDRVLVDDPHNVKDGESELVRRSTLQYFTEVLPTRLNSPINSSIVVIMQRVNEEDVSGHIISKNLDYVHLMLPMEYDSSRKCATSLPAYPDDIFFEDPRTEDGELLFPERMPEWVVERDKKVMGSYAVAGQFQQSPTPRGGGIIKDKWWKLYPEQGEALDESGKPASPLEYPPMEFIVAFADTAYTTKEENDYSALTVWGVWRKDGAPKVMLMAGWKERLELNALVTKISNTCSAGKGIPVDRLLIENKASGKSVAQEITRLFDNAAFGVELVEPKGDKIARMYAVQHLFENGIVHAPDREWSQMVIDDVAKFPKGSHDDIADTVSGALKWLRDSNFALRSDEYDEEELQRDTYRKPMGALYDV